MSNIPINWSEVNNMLQATYSCKDFRAALKLVNSIGEIAEKLQHHPDVGIKNYNQVVVTTTTHDTNSITEKDYRLAEEINQIVNG